MTKTRTSRLFATATSAALLAILTACSGTSSTTAASSTASGGPTSAAPTTDAPTPDDTGSVPAAPMPSASGSGSAAVVTACQKSAAAYSAFQSGYDPNSSLPKQALAAATAGLAYAQIALAVIENAGGANLGTSAGALDQSMNKQVTAVSTDFEDIYNDFKDGDQQSGAALISGQLQTDLNALTSSCQGMS